MNIDLPNKTLPFSIKRSKRKTLGLYVENQQVEVRAPFYVSEHDILDWVHSKADWINKQLQKQALQATEKPVIEHGGRFLFLGKERNIELITGPPAIFEKEDTLIIARRKNTAVEKFFLEWLRNEAELYITARTIEIAEEMQDAHKLTGVEYRKTKSKWGHCTSQGKLQFNWHVIMAPPDVIDYLIIHELSHLSHMNHSKSFWRRVEKFCPDYKKHEQWLDRNGHKVFIP